MSGGLVLPAFEEFSTVYCDPQVKGFGIPAFWLCLLLDVLVLRSHSYGAEGGAGEPGGKRETCHLSLFPNSGFPPSNPRDW